MPSLIFEVREKIRIFFMGLELAGFDEDYRLRDFSGDIRYYILGFRVRYFDNDPVDFFIDKKDDTIACKFVTSAKTSKLEPVLLQKYKYDFVDDFRNAGTYYNENTKEWESKKCYYFKINNGSDGVYEFLTILDQYGFFAS